MFSLSVVHFQTSGLIKQFMEKLDQIMIFIKIIWEMHFFSFAHNNLLDCANKSYDFIKQHYVFF